MDYLRKQVELARTYAIRGELRKVLDCLDRAKDALESLDAQQQSELLHDLGGEG